MQRVFLFLWLMLALPVNASEYQKYCNGRYGFCVDYPAYLGMGPEPDNGDGRSFYDDSNFNMTVSGGNNVLDETLASAMQATREGMDTVTYETRGKNWFVLSGYRGSSIIYVKTYVGKGSRNQLYLQYPVQSKQDYDAVVTRISRSFKPGNIAVPH